MATEIKVWEINQDRIVPMEDASLAISHVEGELETWIAQRPDILGEDLLVIGRQLEIQGVGRLDLLCIDASGKLVVVELKRDRLPREAVAQALDYASWLDSATESQVSAYTQGFLNRQLEDAFREHFGCEMPELVCQNHRILVVASRLDAAAERIVDYLSERHGVDINAIFFKYAKLSGGKEILVRSVLVTDEIRKARTASGRRPTVPELFTVAEKNRVKELVEICRQVNEIWKEEPQNTYGGSLRYWDKTPAEKWKMVFGINVAGDRFHPPPGQLDVWIPTAGLAEATGVKEATIRQTLEHEHPLREAQPTDCIVGLRNAQQSEKLVRQLKTWASAREEKAAPPS